jgi:fructokinase
MIHPALLSFGEVLWDLFYDGPRFGGAPANFACHAALLGGNVSMLSAVGEDAKGERALDFLRGFRIDTSLIQRTPLAPTGEVHVGFDAEGNHAFTIAESSAWDHIEWPDALSSRLNQINAVYFGTLGQRHPTSRGTLRRLLELAKTRELHRILDINLRSPFFDDALILDSVACASVLKLSHEELPTVAQACGIPHEDDAQQTLQALLGAHSLDLIAMTRGADGAMLVSPTETLEHPGFPTEVIDTVGAGDAFTAALAVGLLRGSPLEHILHIACKTASEVCSQQGAIPDL